MYISDTQNPNNISDDDTTVTAAVPHDMMIEVAPTTSLHHHLPNHAGPKKRAETWAQDETKNLISLRRDMDSLFNTSKSNKHLWEQISAKMRERGFDRSPTMCTDKWRNLLKEFKKARGSGSSPCDVTVGIGNGNGSGNGNGAAKMSYYKEIDEILRERNRCSNSTRPVLHHDEVGGGSGSGSGVGSQSSKVDSFLHFSDKGMDDSSIPFGPMEANGRTALNLERQLDREGHPLAITAADTVTGGEVPPSFWREIPGNVDDTHSYGGRVIIVKWGDYTRRVGIDGTAEAIKDVIRSAFGLRSKRAFWLEDEDQVVRSLDREMPLGTYTLHLDEGMTVKLCHYEESDHISYPGQAIPHTEEKTFYTEEDFRDFMNHRAWSGLRELNGYRTIHNLDDLRPDELYRGVS